tara:strand:- start:179 stop:658 length:480 start_codon:yes stop_codon:yes gene_type:complete
MAKTSRWFKASCLDWETVFKALPRPLSQEAMRMDYLSLQSQGYSLSQRALAQRWECSRGKVSRLIQACDPKVIQNRSKNGPGDLLRTPNIKRYPIQKRSKTDPKPDHPEPKSDLLPSTFEPLRKENKRIYSSQSEHGFKSTGEAQVLSFRERLMRVKNG